MRSPAVLIANHVFIRVCISTHDREALHIDARLL
jgi:hypothetical protein